MFYFGERRTVNKMEGPYLFLAYFALINIVSFLLMGSDKRKARQQKWRIPEKNIWLLAFLGGAAGGWTGKRVFRHKTRHLSFKWGFPLLSCLHIVLIVYFLINP